MMLFSAKMCIAQSNGPSQGTNSSGFFAQAWNGDKIQLPTAATNWGKSINGVQLLIYSSNSVVEIGNSTMILAVIKNGSTNAIRLLETSPRTDFEFSLSNAAGKLSQLNPGLWEGRRLLVTTEAGKASALNISVDFPTNLEAGEYTLTANRIFFVNDEKFELESNLLKVKVKGVKQ